MKAAFTSFFVALSLYTGGFIMSGADMILNSWKVQFCYKFSMLQSRKLNEAQNSQATRFILKDIETILWKFKVSAMSFKGRLYFGYYDKLAKSVIFCQSRFWCCVYSFQKAFITDSSDLQNQIFIVNHSQFYYYFVDYFFLEYSWPTMLCKDSVHSKVNQLHTHIYSFFSRFPSYIGHHRGPE